MKKIAILIFISFIYSNTCNHRYGAEDHTNFGIIQVGNLLIDYCVSEYRNIDESRDYVYFEPHVIINAVTVLDKDIRIKRYGDFVAHNAMSFRFNVLENNAAYIVYTKGAEPSMMKYRTMAIGDSVDYFFLKDDIGTWTHRYWINKDTGWRYKDAQWYFVRAYILMCKKLGLTKEERKKKRTRIYF